LRKGLIRAALLTMVLTQNTWFFCRMGPLELLRLRHTSRVGGASDTEHTAVAVKPALPQGPSVVTTWTAAPSWDMPSRNIFWSTVTIDSGATASNTPTTIPSAG
jgi:hypothetical protein